MAFISLTRLRVRSARYLPAFAVHAWRTTRQASTAPGNLGVRLRRTKGLTFWTFTAWADEQAMRDYRSASPHRKAMPRLKHWCDEAAVAHWSQTDDALPGWAQAVTNMSEIGRLSKVSNPSPIQRRGEINVS